jgi:type I restriction enzyme S subunit
LKADEYVPEGYAFISAFNIQDGKLIWDPLNYITKERYDESPEIKIKIGDVLIVKDGAGIGKCARVDALPMGETAPNGSLAVVTPRSRLEYRYLAYSVQSTVFQSMIFKLWCGMGVPHFTQEVMKEISILIPSFSEQQAIADYLDKKCASIDESIERSRALIEELGEYKKSLIYEVVTGKREV